MTFVPYASPLPAMSSIAPVNPVANGYTLAPLQFGPAPTAQSYAPYSDGYHSQSDTTPPPLTNPLAGLGGALTYDFHHIAGNFVFVIVFLILIYAFLDGSPQIEQLQSSAVHAAGLIAEG